MKLAVVLDKNGYTPADQQAILSICNQLVKTDSADSDLIELIAAKVAGWRLPPTTIVAAILAVNPDHMGNVKADPRAVELARELVRYHGWYQKLILRSKHPTSTANLINLFLQSAADRPSLLLLVLSSLARLKLADDQSTPDLARRGRLLLAPLADRLGLGQLKNTLEDTCFKILEPTDFAKIEQLASRSGLKTAGYVKQLKQLLGHHLRLAGIKIVNLEGRHKHLYSIQRKLGKSGNIDSVYDLVGLRLIVPTTEACYQALTQVHSLWPPLPGRQKDYIAKPKRNGYRSIHTTVKAIDDRPIEIQIRTPAMHEAAEEGVAAHWRYDQLKTTKDYQNGEPVAKVKPPVARIYAFSPKGDVYRLPVGATALDFAFAVHSKLGAQARAVKVNGKIAKLSQELSNGDEVEVVTQKSARPHNDWLRFVKTDKARNRIRYHLSHT